MSEIPAGALRPEDVPAEWVDAVYPVTLAHGIPWHDDAIRILIAAAAPAVAAQARRQAAEALRAIAGSPELCRRLVARHPALQAGTTVAAVVEALADEIENPAANERTTNA